MTADSIFIIDQFVTVKPGEPYRLVPYGKLYKNGDVVNFTPELARQVQLPHYKPAIKLGSHKDVTPAGGHIIGLEVRADGLYAIPEWNENGTAAIDGGAYRYHSPEIAWKGGLLDSTTGNIISAPLLLGDALLHNPALGEATAFYQIESHGGESMSEMTQVPSTLWERIMDRLFSADVDPAPEPEPTTQTPDPQVDAYAAQLEAANAELAQYRAQIEQMEAAQQAQARVSHFAAEFAESTAVADDGELHTLLAGLDAEVADQLVQRFKALSAQIDETALTGDVGAAKGEATGPDAVHAAVQKYQAEHSVSYNDAVAALANERPELFAGGV